ncbi:hypothetical protein F5Y06DRAFT_271271 [Hypoxylon sp. FL0890]|nr:hypothetical protein F5Y06DRAFT_271271 [Hypoxylon sp. FL0890]
MERDIAFFKEELDWRGKYAKHAKRALLLDRVMEDHAFTSRSRLLQLPTSILTDIVDLLADDKPTLASLALVNTTCRQLARSSQFAEIRFDYSKEAYLLLFRLLIETTDRISSNQHRPTIRACIRKFTMENSDYFHDDQIWKIASSSFKRSRFWRLLINRALLHYALPNLEYAVWNNSEYLDETFYRGIMRCSAQYVKLIRLFIDKSAAVAFVQEAHKLSTWPVRFLELDIGLLRQRSPEFGVLEPIDEMDDKTRTILCRFFDRLFRACATTLESLTWHYIYDWHGPTLSCNDELISFPRLRFLKINAKHIPSYILSSFLRAPLRHFHLLRIVDRDDMGEALANCDPIRSLETLVIRDVCPSEKNAARIVEFLKRHEHIQKLHVQEQDWISGQNTRIVPYIIPLLSKGGFTNLKSLSLGFGICVAEEEEIMNGTVSIPESPLRVIGRITSLEQLHLSAGCGRETHQWLIDHDKLRETLHGLKRLRKLAFSADTYQSSDPRSLEAQFYYHGRLWSDSCILDAKARPDLDDDDDLGDLVAKLQILDDDTIRTVLKAQDKLWEKAHRNRMLSQAEKYAAVLPALEWVYFGQRTMSIRQDPKNPGRRMAWPLTKEREGFYSLYDMFAMGTGHSPI